MKTLAFIMLLFFVACTPRPATVLKVDYLKLVDSIEVLNNLLQQNIETIQTLRDSIAELKDRPLMTSEQFLQLYKYERLNKYYRICKKKPDQWKYYKGWSTRVFETDDQPETPELVMAKGFDYYFLARENFEKAALLYDKRNNFEKGDYYNSINTRSAIHLIAQAYNEISAINEKLKQ